jgi:hypothetical protein
VRPRKVVDLRPKGRAVAAPAKDKEQLPPPAPSPLVVQPHIADFSERHDQAIVSRSVPSPKHSRGPVLTLRRCSGVYLVRSGGSVPLDRVCYR